MNESPPKQVPPFGLRLPPDLKERVQQAAEQGKTSMNALIASVLEREFPQPTINLHELAAFLAGLSSDEEGRGYLAEVNRKLASAKQPWTVTVDGFGVVSFYPYATKPDAVTPPETDLS